MTGTHDAIESGPHYYARIERLVGGAVTGDRDSLIELYDETAPRVLGIVSRVLGPGETAHEVTVQVFEAIWTHEEEAPCAAGLPWLVDVARRTALAHHRARLVPRQRVTEPKEPKGPKRPPFPPAREWMPQLRAEERDALHLVYLQGHTAAEADARLDWVPGTTVITLREAMLHLAELQNQAPTLVGSA